MPFHTCCSKQTVCNISSSSVLVQTSHTEPGGKAERERETTWAREVRGRRTERETGTIRDKQERTKRERETTTGREDPGRRVEREREREREEPVKDLGSKETGPMQIILDFPFTELEPRGGLFKRPGTNLLNGWNTLLVMMQLSASLAGCSGRVTTQERAETPSYILDFQIGLQNRLL